MLLLRLPAVMAVVALLVVSAPPAVPEETLSACRVTIPNGNTPPGERPSRLHHGNASLWTALWPEGRVVFGQGSGSVLPDGSLVMKFPWWRSVRGKLNIEGRRLNAAAPPLRASIPEGYGDTGFQATGLIFPSTGCWEVRANVGEANLTFVTEVVRGGDNR